MAIIITMIIIGFVVVMVEAIVTVYHIAEVLLFLLLHFSASKLLRISWRGSPRAAARKTSSLPMVQV